MDKIGSEFLRETNNKETMQILELICHTSLGYARPFQIARITDRKELFWQYIFSLKTKANENFD